MKDFDEFNKLSNSEFINQLFLETDENNVLCVPSWYENEEKYLYKCEMKWKKEDLKDLINKCDEHIDKVKKCVKKIEYEADEKIAKNKLDDDLFDFWNKYIRKFDEENDILSEIIYESVPYIEGKRRQPTSNVNKILKKYKEAIYKQAKNRIGENDFSYGVIIETMRYFHLFYYDAPEVVIDHERVILLFNLVLYNYCISTTKIKREYK